MLLISAAVGRIALLRGKSHDKYIMRIMCHCVSAVQAPIQQGSRIPFADLRTNKGLLSIYGLSAQSTLRLEVNSNSLKMDKSGV